MVALMIATVICRNDSLLYHLITFVLPEKSYNIWSNKFFLSLSLSLFSTNVE